MKKQYTEPQFELLTFCFDSIMSGLTLHSQTEHGGTSGALSDDEGDDIIIDP